MRESYMYFKSFYNELVDAMYSVERSFSEIAVEVLRVAFALHLHAFDRADDSDVTVRLLVDLAHKIICADNDICNDAYLESRDNAVVAESAFFQARFMLEDAYLVVFDEAHTFDYAYNYALIVKLDDKYFLSVESSVAEKDEQVKTIIVRESLEALLYAFDEFYRYHYNILHFFDTRANEKKFNRERNDEIESKRRS